MSEELKEEWNSSSNVVDRSCNGNVLFCIDRISKKGFEHRQTFPVNEEIINTIQGFWVVKSLCLPTQRCFKKS